MKNVMMVVCLLLSVIASAVFGISTYNVLIENATWFGWFAQMVLVITCIAPSLIVLECFLAD